ncbi:hypothetical protein KQH41_00055 [bacterium]|nr:hypothetical protein [bacterium]
MMMILWPATRRSEWTAFLKCWLKESSATPAFAARICRLSIACLRSAEAGWLFTANIGEREQQYSKIMMTFASLTGKPFTVTAFASSFSLSLDQASITIP